MEKSEAALPLHLRWARQVPEGTDHEPFGFPFAIALMTADRANSSNAALSGAAIDGELPQGMDHVPRPAKHCRPTGIMPDRVWREDTLYVNNVPGSNTHGPPQWQVAPQQPAAYPAQYAPQPSPHAPHPSYGFGSSGAAPHPSASVPLAHATHVTPYRTSTGVGTPLYDSLIQEWQGMDRCSPGCCRPGTTPVFHLGGGRHQPL